MVSYQNNPRSNNRNKTGIEQQIEGFVVFMVLGEDNEVISSKRHD